MSPGSQPQSENRQELPLPSEQPDWAGVLADQRLVGRCLAGEVAAWEQLHRQCHEPLLRLIRGMLGPNRCDPNLVDEIAARVWYAVIDNDAELLARFQPVRGYRVITFLRALAKDEASRYFRSERRRRSRETEACRGKPPHVAADANEATVSLGEFLASLTPLERDFCGQHLLSSAVPLSGGREEIEAPESSPRGWQIARRIRRKLLAFLGLES